MPISLNDEKQIGSIFSSGRSDAPTGYLLCNGSNISRTVYKNLFDTIGITYGVGDGSTTFTIPDLRGAVPRGAGTSNGYTQNVTVTLGSKDNDATQEHKHNYGDGGKWTTNSGGDLVLFVGNGGGGGVYSSTSSTTDGSNGTPRTGNETKMKNVGMNFFIKF
jgi:microcystin-dependent protein